MDIYVIRIYLTTEHIVRQRWLVAKLSVNLVDGIASIDRLFQDTCNESEYLVPQVDATRSGTDFVRYSFIAKEYMKPGTQPGLS